MELPKYITANEDNSVLLLNIKKLVKQFNKNKTIPTATDSPYLEFRKDLFEAEYEQIKGESEGIAEMRMAYPDTKEKILDEQCPFDMYLCPDKNVYELADWRPQWLLKPQNMSPYTITTIEEAIEKYMKKPTKENQFVAFYEVPKPKSVEALQKLWTFILEKSTIIK
jgi:hypothetical protein